jgi:F0F1-type ATP synthase assembly protein I
MVLPIGLGYLVDSWLGTRIVGVAIGAICGMALGMWHLMQIAAKSSGRRKRSAGPPNSPDRQS